MNNNTANTTINGNIKKKERFKLSLLKPKNNGKKKSPKKSPKKLINLENSCLGNENTILNYYPKAAKINNEDNNLEEECDQSKKTMSKSRSQNDQNDVQESLLETIKLSEVVTFKNKIKTELNNSVFLNENNEVQHNSVVENSFDDRYFRQNSIINKGSKQQRRKLFSESIFDDDDLAEDSEMFLVTDEEHTQNNTGKVHFIIPTSKNKKITRSNLKVQGEQTKHESFDEILIGNDVEKGNVNLKEPKKRRMSMFESSKKFQSTELCSLESTVESTTNNYVTETTGISKELKKRRMTISSPSKNTFNCNTLDTLKSYEEYKETSKITNESIIRGKDISQILLTDKLVKTQKRKLYTEELFDLTTSELNKMKFNESSTKASKKSNLQDIKKTNEASAKDQTVSKPIKKRRQSVKLKPISNEVCDFTDKNTDSSRAIDIDGTENNVESSQIIVKQLKRRGKTKSPKKVEKITDPTKEIAYQTHDTTDLAVNINSSNELKETLKEINTNSKEDQRISKTIAKRRQSIKQLSNEFINISNNELNKTDTYQIQTLKNNSKKDLNISSHSDNLDQDFCKPIRKRRQSVKPTSNKFLDAIENNTCSSETNREDDRQDNTDNKDQSMENSKLELDQFDGKPTRNRRQCVKPISNEINDFTKSNSDLSLAKHKDDGTDIINTSKELDNLNRESALDQFIIKPITRRRQSLNLKSLSNEFFDITENDTDSVRENHTNVGQKKTNNLREPSMVNGKSKLNQFVCKPITKRRQSVKPTPIPNDFIDVIDNDIDSFRTDSTYDNTQDNTESSSLVVEQPKKRGRPKKSETLVTSSQISMITHSLDDISISFNDTDINSATLAAGTENNTSKTNGDIDLNIQNTTKIIKSNDNLNVTQTKKRGRPKLDASLKKTPGKICQLDNGENSSTFIVETGTAEQPKKRGRPKLNSSLPKAIKTPNNDITNDSSPFEKDRTEETPDLLQLPYKRPKGRPKGTQTHKNAKINLGKNLTKAARLKPNGKITKESLKLVSSRKIPQNRLEATLAMLKDECHPIWEDRNISCNFGIHRYWEPRHTKKCETNLKMKYARQFLLRRDWMNLSKVLCLTAGKKTPTHHKLFYPLVTKYAALCLAHTDKDQFNKFVQFIVGIDTGSTAVIKKCTSIIQDNNNEK